MVSTSNTSDYGSPQSSHAFLISVTCVAENTNDFHREIYHYVRGETRFSVDYIFPECSIMYFIISKVVPNIKAKLGLSRVWNNGNMHTLLV